MNTQLGVCRIAVHQIRKRPHILRVPQQRQNARLIREPLVGIICQASFQAPRVVLEWIRRVIRSAIDQRQAVGAHVQGVVDKRARRDAAAAGTGGHINRRVAGIRVDDNVVRRRVVLRRTIARHGGLAAVEDGRVGHPTGRRLGPVPVGQGTLVPAFVAQRLFVLPDEPAVPAEEVGVEVDCVCLVNVCHDPIVEASLCARCKRGRRLSFFALEAEHGVCVRYALLGGEIVPTNWSVRTAC